jgi:hypothetical protein
MVPAVALDAWRGIAVPGGTARQVVAALENSIRTTTSSPEFIAAAEKLGVRPAFGAAGGLLRPAAPAWPAGLWPVGRPPRRQRLAIAERGVQLIGTAHGNTIENLMMNPTLSDLIGGIQSVTLSDEEARRRGTQKSILERKAPPTFTVMVEIQDRDRYALYRDVAESVDAILRGSEPDLEIRERRADGSVESRPVRPRRSQDELEQRRRQPRQRDRGQRARDTRELDREADAILENQAGPGDVVYSPQSVFGPGRGTREKPLRVFAFGVSRNRLEQAITTLSMPATIVRDLHDAVDYPRLGTERAVRSGTLASITWLTVCAPIVTKGSAASCSSSPWDGLTA